MAPLEARDEAVFEVFDFAGRAVAGEDDLFVAFEQGVEGVEEFLLGLHLAGDELDVVNEEDIGLAEAFAEASERVRLNGVDVLVDEFLTGTVHHAGAGFDLAHPGADGLHEVGLAESAAAEDEERIVGAPGFFRDGTGGGVGEAVGGTDDEVVERHGLAEAVGVVLHFLHDLDARRGMAGFRGDSDSDFIVGRGRRDGDFDVVLHAGDGAECGLEHGHVVHLDPQLMDRVRHEEMHGLIAGGGELDRAEPADKGIIADAGAEVLADEGP